MPPRAHRGPGQRVGLAPAPVGQADRHVDRDHGKLGHPRRLLHQPGQVHREPPARNPPPSRTTPAQRARHPSTPSTATHPACQPE